MSDTADYSGTTQGAVDLLSTGTLNAVGAGNFSLVVNNIPGTVRSLLLLVLVTGVHGAGEAATIPVAVGNVSKQWWRPIGVGQGWQSSAAGGAPLGVNTPMTPLYFPFYGLVDTGVTISWAFTPGGAGDQVEYWLLGLPDPDLSGSDLNPLSVTCGINAVAGTITPLPVVLWNSDGVDQPGTTAHPLYVATGPNNTVETNPYGAGDSITGALAVTAITSGTAQQLLPAPAAGQLTVVDLLTFQSGSAATTLFIDGSSLIANPGIAVNVPAANPNIPGYPGPLVFNEPVKVFAGANVSAVVRAKAHLVNVSA